MNLVILVEDSKPDAELLKTIIQDLEMDIEIHWFKNGVECINFFNEGNLVGRNFSDEHKILMLIDLNMPRVNGLELLDALSLDEDYKKIPKIIYTTSNSAQDIQKAYEKGALSCIIKPFRFEDIVTKIDSLIKYWFEVVSSQEITIKERLVK